FGGIKLWGDYLNNAIGLGSLLGIKPQLEDILMHRISLLDITLVIGAFSAALLSRQFRINRPPILEYVWAIVGGILMGLGATLAGGCTTGGFFVPLTFSSYAGWGMWLGLLVGAVIGLKLLLWTMENISWGMNAPAVKPARFKQWYPWIGVLVVVLTIIWAINWWGSGDEKKAVRALLILAGFGIGFILHRSRFCFSRVFREPFMTAEGEMTKAMILAIALGAPVGAALIAKGAIDPYLAIPSRFWLGSLSGGLVFGIGMVFAGGCASGSLWRVGEGHIKLMVAVLFFAWGGSTSSALLSKAGLMTTGFDLEFMDGMAEVTPLGVQAFMPDMMGSWGGPLLLTYGLLLFWYLMVRYNESTNRFTVF
ncbi:MAG: YeeE/YedE thiosulfate transporter family protein, partial [Gammaproteobacteria bacterium]|nr:YeeE/YedE thiosulfate transporter family protein [Gammaproteobacteria bacterium]